MLDLLFPRRCAVCGRLGPVVCDACEVLLRPVGPPGCERCGAPGPWPIARCTECAGRRIAFVSARSALLYDARARSLVAAWKERGRRDVAGWAAGRVARTLPRPPVQALVPVPGDRDRTLRRGHVPAAKLAEALGVDWGLPLSRALRRTGPATRQRGLQREERRRNVRGRFRATGPVPAEVCLIDDVYTTGATANACALELRRAGAEEVRVITLARVVR